MTHKLRHNGQPYSMHGPLFEYLFLIYCLYTIFIFYQLYVNKYDLLNFALVEILSVSFLGYTLGKILFHKKIIVSNNGITSVSLLKTIYIDWDDIVHVHQIHSSYAKGITLPDTYLLISRKNTMVKLYSFAKKFESLKVVLEERIDFSNRLLSSTNKSTTFTLIVYVYLAEFLGGIIMLFGLIFMSANIARNEFAL